MSYVITNACLGEQYAQCVDVCPVNCIYPGTHNNQPFMVIDPEICINCQACLPVCPINAIVATEEEAPEAASLNAKLAPNFQQNPPVTPRPPNDPPHRPENTLQ